jgi:hypothetical protein
VIWARQKVGSRATLIAVETCQEGQGDLALSVPMFEPPGAFVAEKVGNRTKYRGHRDHCPAAEKGRAVLCGGAFSAGGGRRKERPA